MLRIVPFALIVALSLGCGAPAAQLTGDVVTADAQAAMTPDAVLAELKAGNERFVSKKVIARDYLAQVNATAKGQYPKAIILGCLDSRVPPEVVFDQGIGDLFVGRVAGNFENVDMLGSMEFGTKLAGSKLIVVLGHTSCGAVKGAVAGAKLGNLTETLENLAEPLAEAKQKLGADASNDALVDATTEANVRMTVRDILGRSEVMRDLVESGDLKVVGAIYDIATGKVRWL
jgi:carbonic anhydrase